MAVSWETQEQEIYDGLLAESKFKSISEKALLKSLSASIAKYKYLYSEAVDKGNKNAARIYKNNLEFFYSDFKSEVKKREGKLSLEKLNFLQSIIGKVIEGAIVGKIGSSLESLPIEEQEKIKKGISEVFNKSLTEASSPSVEKVMAELSVEKLAAELAPLIKKFSEEGNYMGGVFEAAALGMSLVKNVQGMSGEEKKSFVVKGFQYSYKKFNPDLPFIDGMAEEFAEQYMLEKLLPAAIDALFKASKEQFLHKPAA